MSFKQFLNEATEPQMPTFAEFKPFADQATKFSSNDQVRFEKALTDLQSYITAKDIYAVQFGDIKSTLDRGCEKILDFFVWELYEFMKGKVWGQELANQIYYTSRNITSSVALDKRLTALVKGQAFDPAPKPIAELHQLVKLIVRLKIGFDFLKPFIKKGRVPNPNAVPKFAPTFSHDIYKKTFKKMEEAIEPLKKMHWDRVAEMYIQAVDRMLTLEASTPNYIYNYLRSSQSTLEKQLLWKVKDYDKQGPLYKTFELRADWKKILTNEALKDINNIYLRFCGKNSRKLSAIFEKVGDPIEENKLALKLNGTSLEAHYEYKFGNGAAFEVTNSIEWAISKTGTEFIRLPTRFTNVKMSDGTKMGMPSEEKMNTQFK